jgi:deoxyribodipyrimidine photo-lyase
MQRDQRVQNNWALTYAQACAVKAQQPLMVLFNLVPRFGDTTLRHYDFMFAGLKEVEEELHSLGIPFIVTTGKPTDTIPAFVKKHSIGHVVVDQNPLRFTEQWRQDVASLLSVCMTEVDAHNVVPVWYASPKEEFAAYTFRPKVTKLLPEFRTSLPKVSTHPYPTSRTTTFIDWEALLKSQKPDTSVSVVSWLVPGSKAGLQRLKRFVGGAGEGYHTERNNLVKNALSHLSPYLHFGQISAEHVVRTVERSDLPRADKEAYLEELIVRRELADNFCFYNQNYDVVAGAHAWAQQTIAEHQKDKRAFLYTRDQLESGATHDDLWNAMQQQMVTEGKLHGWCRMYWAKKMLEWTPDAQTAIDYALYLNDRYELDGSDPNGVVGVMWSICGVHDRAWNERPIFGKIRYMNYAGAKRKFAIKEYIANYAATQPTLTP